MILRPPKSTRTETIFPYTTLCRSGLTGEMLDAERMHQYGLVNRLVEPGDALQAALDLGRTIAANGPLAVRAAKRIIVESRNWRPSDMFDLQRPRIAHVFASEDRSEERRVGKECVSTCRSRWSPYH